jgi:alpha-beta hydrolase superfamily lysophospholipase
MKDILKDTEYNFEVIRLLSQAVYGGSDTTECLATVARVKEGNAQSWYAEWTRTAEDVRKIAEKCLEEAHIISAREAFLRAANYYRSSEFFLHDDPEDLRVWSAWEDSRTCFAAAAKLFVPPVEQVHIPYQGKELPGYFYRVDESNQPRPTVILQTGFDGTVEELHFDGAVAAVRRGYNCLTIEGPGQGRLYHREQLYFRPDWDKVITPVVNFLSKRTEVNNQKIALIGLSFGGFLAARAAAYEPRLAACVVNGSLLDLGEVWKAKLPQVLRSQLENPFRFNLLAKVVTGASPALKYAFTDAMWKFGATNPHEFMKLAEAYTLEGYTKKIKCPTLVCESSSESYVTGQAAKFFEALACEKAYIRFSEQEAVDRHNQVGARLRLHQRIFDWLDDIIYPQSNLPEIAAEQLPVVSEV